MICFFVFGPAVPWRLHMRPMLQRLATRLLRKLCAFLPWLDGPRIRHIQTAYEKAGCIVRGEPIPWNADAVLIEVHAWFPLRASPRSEFALDVSGEPRSAHRRRPWMAIVERSSCFPHAGARPCRVGIYWRAHLLARNPALRPRIPAEPAG